MSKPEPHTQPCESCEGTGKYNPATVSWEAMQFYARAQSQRKRCPDCNGSGIKVVRDQPSQSLAELQAAARYVRETATTPEWAQRLTAPRREPGQKE